MNFLALQRQINSPSIIFMRRSWQARIGGEVSLQFSLISLSVAVVKY